MKAGIAVKPSSSIDPLTSLLESGDLSMVLVMTVEPGFGGQSFQYDCLAKVEQLRKKYPSLFIQVDGGINLNNISDVIKAGANVLVAGTSVFGSENPKDVIVKLKSA